MPNPEITVSRVLRRIDQPPGPAGQITHGMCLAGAAGAAAGDTSLGAITLPAGGPWRIFKVWAQIAAATSTAAQAMGGAFHFVGVDGDIEPNPSPSRFPLGLLGSFLGALNDVQVHETAQFEVDWTAPGKARIELFVNTPTLLTVAPQVIVGVMFGPRVPDHCAIRWIDRVRAGVAVAVDTLVGTITLAEKATRVRWVGCQLATNGVLVAGEELLGLFRLSSDDINLAPAQYHSQAAFSAGLGAQILQTGFVKPSLIAVDIPVLGGARIDCFIDLNTALTNPAEVEIFIAYE